MRELTRRSRLFFVLAALASILFAFERTAAADTLDDIRKDGHLRWAGDQEGGGPYVYPRDDNPDAVTGFEVDLAAKLAEYLKVRPEFTQGNWDKLPDMLRTKKADIILNGYEWTAGRADLMESSIPYYIYALQLLARKDDSSVTSWDDLKKPSPSGGKRRVGVLSASAAYRYLVDRLGENIEVVIYEGNADAMAETQTGKLDACVQDTPIATFYAPRFPALRPVGEPVSEGYYVILARKGDAALVRALNDAIVLLLRNGELERIYRKWGVWNDSQKRILTIAEAGRFFGLASALDAKLTSGGDLPTEETVHLSARKRGFEVAADYGGVLLQSAGVTVLLSVLSFPCAIVLGLFIALGRLYGPTWLRAPLTSYVEFLRGTPLMLQLYFIFFFLPEVGIRIPAFATCILGLALNYSAYEAEIYRAGLQSIPVGQMEAALSLGMSRITALRRVVVPQAVRIVVPPVVNDFIALFKDTSVCSVVTVVELTKRYSVLSMSTQATVELMAMTAVLYLLMSYPMSLAARSLEKRYGVPVTA